MAIRQVGQQTSLNKLEYQIEIGDPLPTELTENNNGSICTNLNNGEIHVWHIDKWISLGGGSGVSGILFNMSGTVTNSNTAAEISMIGGGLGDRTIKADSLKVGDTIRLDFSHRLSSGNGQSSTVRLKLGVVTIETNTATLPNGLSATKFGGYVDIMVTAIGTSGKVKVIGDSKVVQNNSAVLSRDLDNTTETTVNTTIDNVIDFTYQYLSANASNICVSHQMLLRKL